MAEADSELLIERPGIKVQRYYNGWNAVSYHYSSHPEKTTEWAEHEALSYPGGIRGAAWRAEMELDFGARQGEKVYMPPWDPAVHIIDPIELDPSWARFRTIDLGYANPTACLWGCLSPEGVLYLYKEYYHSRKTVPENSGAIRSLSARERYDWTLMDPSAFSQRPESPEPLSSQYAEEGIFAGPADNRVEDGIANVLKWLHIQDDGKPSLFVFRTMRNFIFEVEKYRYKKIDPAKQDETEIRERPIAVDDHLLDCLRYMIQGCPDLSETARKMGFNRPSIQERCWASYRNTVMIGADSEDLSGGVSDNIF
ncbi:MAG: hypothetical protein GY937_19955 [bacterium]|nr:hypothetical protein [bacterium]